MLDYIKQRAQMLSDNGDSLITDDNLGVCFALIKACDKLDVPVQCYTYRAKPKNSGSRNSTPIKHEVLTNLCMLADAFEVITYNGDPKTKQWQARSNQTTKWLKKPVYIKTFDYAVGLMR